MFNHALPLISICIPVYNGKPFIANCLKSIALQDYENFEVVLVDDCSKDGTLELVNLLGAKYPFLKIFTNSVNLGLVGNWNRCMELSTGKWIKFVFQDDWIAPDCLTKMVLAGESTKASLVVCDREFVFENISDELRERFENYTERYSPKKTFDGKTLIDQRTFCKATLSNLCKNFIGEPTAVLLRRDDIDVVGKFDSSFIQLCDLEYFSRIALVGGVAYVPEKLAYFRVHGSSATSSNAKDKVFLKEIIDPLLLRHHFCYMPAYAELRATASQIGFDLKGDFLKMLTHEQLWGSHRNSVHWSNLIKEYPRFRLPFIPRMKRLLKRVVHR